MVEQDPFKIKVSRSSRDGGTYFMYKTDPLLVEKCRVLRRKGFALGTIIKKTNLPKTTVYGYIREIFLPFEVKERIKREARKRINDYIRKEKKGKCMPGREFLKPKHWSQGLIFIISHFMFDGQIRYGGCEYYNRSDYLIQKMRKTMETLLGLSSKIYKRDFGVKQLRYSNVELGSYIRKRASELLDYIKTASLIEKKIFLQAFFDDEGCVYKYRNNRKIRGYQHNLEILNLIKKLLKDFDIKSRIEKRGKEIVISGKESFIKFRDKINFSKGIYINLNRKNSIWRKKLEKREILDYIISSYKK